MTKTVKKRILQVITTSKYGGAQRHLILLARGLQKFGYEVSVVCSPNGPLVEELQNLGINVITTSHLIKPISPLTDIKAMLQIYKIIRNNDFDLVHAHSSKAGVLGRLAARLAGVPAVFTAHGFVFSDYTMGKAKQNLYKLIEKFMAYITDCIITVSDFDRTIALKNKIAPEAKFRVVHNGIDSVGFRDIDIKTKNGSVCIGTITRLVHEKGLDTFIEAISLVNKQRPNVKFTITGEGYLKEQLEEKAQELDVSKCLVFHPYHKDIKPILSEIDIFVISSVKEGLPIALLEAMAAGRAIVSTDVGGIPEVIGSSGGILIKPQNPTILAREIIKLVDNQELRVTMGQFARDKVAQNHDWETVTEKVHQVYQEIFSVGWHSNG